MSGAVFFCIRKNQMIEEMFDFIDGGMIYEKNNDRDCTSCFDAHAGIL